MRFLKFVSFAYFTFSIAGTCYVNSIMSQLVNLEKLGAGVGILSRHCDLYMYVT